MFRFLLLSLLLTSLKAEELKDCDNDECLSVVIDQQISVLSKDQCKLQAPGIMFPDYNADSFCGAYLDAAAGVVVTDVCKLVGSCSAGGYEVFAAPVVDECTKMIEDVSSADAESLYKCITACPYLADAPVAKTDAATTPASDVTGYSAFVTNKFIVHATKYNGYTGVLPNNFGAMHGSIDTVAAKVALVLSYDINDGDDSTGCGAMGFKMMPAAPSSFAAAILFPGLAFKFPKTGTQALTKLLSKAMWFEQSVSSGAKLYFYETTTPSDAQILNTLLPTLIETVSKEKATDFASIGKLFSTGELGFLYGVLSQTQQGDSVTNTATLNFAVHGFQESYAYIFFSPLGTDTSDVAGVYRLYAFALNMLIRRYASIADDLCGAQIDEMKAACAAAPAIYPPVKMASTGVVSSARPKPTDLADMMTGFRNYVPQDDGSFNLPVEIQEQGHYVRPTRIYSPPAEVMGLLAYEPAEKIIFDERDVELDSHQILTTLGSFTTEEDPTTAVETPCDLMMAKVIDREALVARRELQEQADSIALDFHRRHRARVAASGSCLGLLSAKQADVAQVKTDVKASSKYLEAFKHMVCSPSGLSAESCMAAFASAFATFASTAQCNVDNGECMDKGLWKEYVDDYAATTATIIEKDSKYKVEEKPKEELQERRLSDVADAALPSLRSATASALPQDGTSARVGARARRRTDVKEHVDKYKEMVQEYANCLAAIPTSKCATNLAQMSSSDAKVTAFYSKTGLVTAACAGILTPSDCPVDMFSKEVSFMWGNGGVKSTYTKSKTSSYIAKGLPAASRIDKFVNFFTELFTAA